MIYEADKGSTIEQAAIKAVENKCNRFTHNDRLFEVEIEYREIGKIKMTDTIPCPVPSKQPPRAATSNDEYDGPPLD